MIILCDQLHLNKYSLQRVLQTIFIYLFVNCFFIKTKKIYENFCIYLFIINLLIHFKNDEEHFDVNISFFYYFTFSYQHDLLLIVSIEPLWFFIIWHTDCNLLNTPSELSFEVSKLGNVVLDNEKLKDPWFYESFDFSFYEIS